MLTSQLSALKQSETLQKQQQAAVQAAKERRESWLASTPAAREHIKELNVLHQAALAGGLADTSPEYFNFMEEQLARLSGNPPQKRNSSRKEMQQRVAQNRPAPEPPAARAKLE